MGTKFTVYDNGVNPQKASSSTLESETLRQELAAVCYVSPGFLFPKLYVILGNCFIYGVSHSSLWVDKAARVGCPLWSGPCLRQGPQTSPVSELRPQLAGSWGALGTRLDCMQPRQERKWQEAWVFVGASLQSSLWCPRPCMDYKASHNLLNAQPKSLVLCLLYR